MKRNHLLLLAFAAAVLLLVGSRLAIVLAQTAAGGGTAPASVPAPKGANVPQNNFAVYPASADGYSYSDKGMMPPGPMGVAFGVDDDPEVAELVQAEATLANESQELVARIAEAENAQDRKKIAADLREVLAKQFDAQRKRRELELTRIENQVRKLREQIKKRDDARDTIIDRRLEQLVNEAEGLGWAPAAGPGRRSGSGLPGVQMMRPPRGATKSVPGGR